MGAIAIAFSNLPMRSPPFFRVHWGMGFGKDDRFRPKPSFGEQGLNDGFVPNTAVLRLLRGRPI